MRRTAFPAAVIVILGSAMAGGLLGSQMSASRQERAEARDRIFSAALAAVETGYVEPVDTEQAVYSSITGMLNTLDPHSSFFTPRDFAQMRERQEGRYYGIGISIVAAPNGDITVTSLFEGSPAYRAGIRRGDVLAKVREESTKGWSTEDVVAKVRGPKGTTVDISIRRPGVEKLFDLTVERDEVKIVSVSTAFMLQPGTGYLRLQDFSETSNDEIGAALQKLGGMGMQRLILDLRDNPGGPLDQAIAIANRFLRKGQMIVYTRGRIENSDFDYRAQEQGSNPDVPLIVLVSRRSASASEIVSGAIQDHDRGLIIGETTFGKALVQSVFPISAGAGLALTTGRYYTPSGRLIQRPWDGSFDEYLTYSLRSQNGNKQHDPALLKYTDSGRKVYSGGGIEPDHFIEGPVEGFDPQRFSRLLVSRGAFIGFAEQFRKAGDTRRASASAAAFTVGDDWQVTDEMLAAFRQYLVSQRVRIDEAAWTKDHDFLKAMIHFEVDNEFSFEEARRNLSSVDPQVQAALGYFDEAKRLLETARSAGAGGGR
ncbi:MAG: S41 family peptidase [Vicinamibacterales bacterium]